MTMKNWLIAEKYLVLPRQNIAFEFNANAGLDRTQF